MKIGTPILLVLAIALLVGGCVAYVHTTLPVVIGGGGYYGHPSYYGRPSSQYFCYECHGYEYFDPYYDYCAYYGFRFYWNTHPSVMRYYREHYDVIHRDTPHFGEYKYKPDYTRDYQYHKPPDYQSWKRTEGGRNFFSNQGQRQRQQPPVIEQPQGKQKGGQQGEQQGQGQGGRRGQPPKESSGKGGERSGGEQGGGRSGGGEGGQERSR